MFKKMMLFWLFVTVLAGYSFANGVDCKERVYKTEEEKQEIAERGKKEFIATLDSIIENDEKIESEKESDQAQIGAFNGDTRQILIYYKYLTYGDKIAQKL